MEMGHERSKPLHNFTLPCGLKWGNQKFLRCAKVDSNREIAHLQRRSNGSESIGRRMREIDVMMNHRRSNGVRDDLLKKMEVGFSRKFRSASYYTGGGGGAEGGNGIAAVREKLMFDLQTEADKMKYAIFRDGLEEEEEKEVSITPAPAPASTMIPAEAVGVDATRPWNLRTRRAACKAPMNRIAGGGGSNGGLKVNVIRNNESSLPSPLRTETKSVRLRSEFVGAGDSYTGEKRKRVNFSVSLNRREIEEDFMAMVGHRPPRRPKKRAKLIQKNLDTLFPGLWLTEISPDLYKVPDDQ
ncbi:uncharacterized protein LOC129874125 [Solanum dulcamara]|uniref:uncharacterized protein LOC129874125 n=1 Tax=Solanum dulcamara TaxID=45834 RepID=UPI002484EBB0|nr:uncharacterized protein LOC129874125 [Solanum dulcamara]